MRVKQAGALIHRNRLTIPLFLLLAGVCGSAAATPADDYPSGRQLNAAGRYTEAAERIEAALLRSPDDRQLQLEYAIALAGSGDVASAQQLLIQLRNEADLDAEMHRQIDALLRKSWLQPYLSNLPHGNVSLVIGHDDNLLGTPSQGAFNLTLPGGNLAVIPSDDQKPRAGFFTRADIRFDGALPVGPFQTPSQPLRYGLFLSLRKTPGQPADRSHWGVMLEKTQLLFPSSYLQASHQQLNVQAEPVYRQTLLGAGLAVVGSAWGLSCRTRLGGELQHRSYPQIDQLDGQYTGLQVLTHCLAPALQLSLRHGQDRPQQASRPGGTQLQTAIKLAHQTSFYQGNVRVEAEWSWQRDATGFSPLLENNRRRALQRGIYRVEYHGQASGPLGWQPFVSLEWMQQQANLPLFSLRNRVISVGVMMNW